MPKRMIVCGVIIALVALLALSACSSSAPVRTGKPIIVTTLYPLYDFTKAVVGDKADVVLLIPPGAEPHEFEPKPSDITTISKATLFVYNGADMEPWADKLLAGMGSTKPPTLEAASVSSLLSADPEGTGAVSAGVYDPHIWLDLGNAQKIVGAIAEQLVTLDPANAPTYNQNADAYVTKLSEVDSAFQAGLADCKRREFITGGHAAFGYLANRYNLKELSAYGISPNAEPSLKHISDLAALAQKDGIKVIYVETFVNPAMAQTLASEVGATTLVLTPGDSVSKEQLDAGIHVTDILTQDLANLRVGLDCK